MRRAALVALAALALIASPNAAQRPDDLGSPRATAPLTLLQLNDVYSTVPVDGAGGLARVATLKRNLAAAGRTPFLVLAGDFLSSSVASTIFKGEQMIAALNAAGLDLATLGNHEFDFGVDLLIERMAEARWQWVVSNVVDVSTGKPIGGAAPYVVRTFGPLKVGFIGLCLTTEAVGRETLRRVQLINPLVAAARYLPALKKERVDVIVALTHLTFAEDQALAQRFPQIDVIVGGHEHFPITAIENRTLISKAGSDARFVARIDINRLDKRHSGAVERHFELVPITAALPDEPRTADVVNSYEARLGPELEVVVASTRVPLDGVAARIRTSETNLGNLVADAMRANAGADIAIVNSGGVRGDRVHNPGPLTRRTLLEIQPFGNVICKIAIPGRIVLDALNHGVAQLPASAGRFPQVSGLTMKVDIARPAGDRVRDVRVLGQPLDPGRTYAVAIPDFIFNGGDGYTMFAGSRVLVDPASGTALLSALETYLAEKKEIAPQIDGRITIVR